MTDGGTCPVVGIPAGDVAFSGDCDTIHTTSENNDYVLDAGDYVMFVGAGRPDGSGIFDGFPCTDGLTTTNAYKVRVGQLHGCGTFQPLCPGDINGDRTTNFSDLLTLLGRWGPCVCPTDCRADISGNDVVDFADVLLLIGNWGPCPTRTPPPCPWDVHANGNIGFDDILDILANWGPCPTTP